VSVGDLKNTLSMDLLVGLFVEEVVRGLLATVEA
jgi:hypothetical protein